MQFNRFSIKKLLMLSFLVSIECVAQQFQTQALNGSCQDGYVCPEDKPMCTPVGCVSECPDNTYANATTCVFDCGNGVVMDRRCLNECPEPYLYTLEKIVTPNFRFRRINMCVKSCPLNMFAYNNVCVEFCPDHSNFITNNTCLSACPNASRYMYELIPNGRKVGVQCTSKCPNTIPYMDIHTCVPRCYNYSMNHICVDACPVNSIVLYTIHSQQICGFECPSGMVFQHGKCVFSCSEGYHYSNYLNYNACVEKCPDDKPIIKVDYMDISVCTASCGEMYNLNNMSCVAKCPPEQEFISNGACFNECLPPTPYLVDRKLKICQSHCGGKLLNDKECVDKCHDDQFVYRNICVEVCPISAPLLVISSHKCVDKCPNDTLKENNYCVTYCSTRNVIFNNTCLKECPNSATLTYALKGKTYCKEVCPVNYLIQNTSCVNECDTGTFSYGQRCFIGHSGCPKEASYNMFVASSTVHGNGYFTCLKTCPNNFLILNNNTCIGCDLYIYNNTCLNKCPSDRFYQNSTGKYCLQKCADETYTSNNTCVEQCPVLSHNKQCVSKCPVIAPYIIEKECVQTCPNGMYKDQEQCVHDCSPRKLTDGDLCVTQCPPERPYTDGNTCVKKCGGEKVSNDSVCEDRYDCKLTRVIYYEMCLSECPDGIFILNNTCVEECPALSHNKLCVSKCPDISPYITGKECAQICPKGMYKENERCVIGCSPQKRIDGELCVTQCPPERPHTDENTCVKNCSGEKVLNDSVCIDRYDCKRVIYDGMCSECPKGTFWFSDVITDNSDEPCTPTYVAYIAAYGMLVLFVSSICGCCIFFRIITKVCLEQPFRDIKTAFQRRIQHTGMNNDTDMSAPLLSDDTTDIEHGDMSAPLQPDASTDIEHGDMSAPLQLDASTDIEHGDTTGR